MKQQKGQKHDRGMFSRRTPLLAATVVICAGLWMLFVGSASLHEMAVGAVILLLTGLFCQMMYRSATLPFQPRWRDIAEVRRIPGNLVVDCWTVFVVLVRDLMGKPPQAALRTAPFAASERDPESVERMVVAISLMTMTPNSIGIGIDPKRNLILYHQLKCTEVPLLAKILGAPR